MSFVSVIAAVEPMADPLARVFAVDVEVGLEPLEVLAHVAGRPAVVAGDPGDVVPVLGVGIQRDHRVMRGAPTERPGTRIEDARLLVRPRVRDVFAVELLLRFIVVVLDEEVPAHRRLFGRADVQRRNLLVRQRALIVARFEQQHAAPGASKTARQRPATRARADDDVVELGLGCGIRVAIRVFTAARGGCGRSNAEKLKELAPTNVPLFHGSHPVESGFEPAMPQRVPRRRAMVGRLPVKATYSK
jgi:hypothetical protein